MLLVIFLLFPSALCVYVETPIGVLEGRTVQSLKQTQYYAFEGIPFAEPPVGKLRFVAPVEATPWKGVYNATYQRSICPQTESITITSLIGNEDCLYLNIYTTCLDVKRKLPVMVYIHGGGYQRNSARQCANPEIFMDFDTLVVSINHRLGVFGFFILDTPEVPGNAALRDVLCVLKWVQKYIRFFGGDPDNVTLIGSSAGGVTIDVIRDSLPFRNLFHKSIILSGNRLIPLNTKFDLSRTTSKYILNSLNITVNGSDTLKIIQKIPTEVLIKLATEANFKYLPIITSAFDITFELNQGNGEAIYVNIEDEVENCVIANSVPTIIGHTSQDYINVPKIDTDVIVSDIDGLILPFNWNLDANETKIVAQQVKEMYFNGRNYNMESVDNYYILFTLFAHVQFMMPSYNRAKQIAKCSNASTYYYLFDYDGSIIRAHYIDFLGTLHGDELPFIFPVEINRVGEASSDGWVRKRLVAMYTNFAKTGNPTPEVSNLLPVTWKPFDIENENYLHCSGDLLSAKRPIHRVAEFWNGLKKKYAKTRYEIVPVWKL